MALEPDPTLVSQFEANGVDFVRAMAPDWVGPLRNQAYLWLKLKDEESRLRNEASQAEQLRIAREASNRAHTAAIAAVIAIPIAIIAIVISALSWLYPRH